MNLLHLLDSRTDTTQRLAYWHALNSIPGIGWSTAQKLLQQFATPQAIFNASTEELKQTGASAKLIAAIYSAALPDVSHEIEWLEQDEKHHVITADCSHYPRLLKEAPGAPLIFYGKGNVELLHRPQLAMVGTRNPSPSGKESAYEFARYLSNAGLMITSGLALGIDGIAHKAALEAGAPTIAVAGTGLDRIYPARHKALAHQIFEQGLIISELPLGTGVRGINFPRRNRIISGISLGVFVVEAAVKSGSLITASYAIEQGKDVFALPGSIHNTVAKGCHALIKQGAFLVETAQDILQHLGFMVQAQQESCHHLAQEPDNEELKQLLRVIDFEPTAMDLLVERSQKSVAELSANLLTLELDGWVAQVSGGYQRQK